MDLSGLVPPRSPSRRRKLSCEVRDVAKEVVKTDSGISLEGHEHRYIAPFHHPFGVASRHVEATESVETLFGDGLDEAGFVDVTVGMGLSRYMNAALFARCQTDGTVKWGEFGKYWGSISDAHHSVEAVAFCVLRGEGGVVGREEAMVAIKGLSCVDVDVTKNHPGLEFLRALPVFQTRYSETVLARLFYSKPHNWCSKMTLSEFKKSGFYSYLLNLDKVEDVNIVSSHLDHRHKTYSHTNISTSFIVNSGS